MPTGLRHCINRFGTQFVGKLLELLDGEVLQVAREMDAVEQRRLDGI